MTANFLNSDERTTPGDENPVWQYRRDVLRDKTALPADYFAETTVPVLDESDLTKTDDATVPTLPNKDLIAASASGTPDDSDDHENSITFLADKHVILDQPEVASPGNDNSSAINALGTTELSPADVISTIEARAIASSSAPIIEYSYTPDSSPAEGAQLDEPFSAETGEDDDIPVDFEDTPMAPHLPGSLLPIDLEEALAISKEEILQKDSLLPGEAYRLYELIKRDPLDPELKAFTKKIAPTDLDFQIFWQNLVFLSPEFVQSILVIGGYHEVEVDVESGIQRTIVFYPGKTLKVSGMGHVFHALMATDSEPSLKPVLIKVPLEDVLLLRKEYKSQDVDQISRFNRAAFQQELEVVSVFKRLMVERQDDPRISHLLSPLFKGHGYTVMPVIRSASGKPMDLNEVAKATNGDISTWSHCLLGAVKGAQLATECGLMDVDLKPANIMQTEQGGVLIDWGGFIDRNAFKRGEISIRTNSISGNLYPLAQNELKEMKEDLFWDLSNGNVQRTQNYVSLDLVARELMEQVPPNTVHKFILYRIIESFLIKKTQHSRDPEEFSKCNDLAKLNYPPLPLQMEGASASLQLLYDLYLKLQTAHHHPFRFINNDPAQGIDKDYISFEEVIARLEELSNLKS